MMVTIGSVRIYLKDLMSYWPTEAGVLGQKHVEGHYVALMLRGAPALVRAGFNSEADRDTMIRKLDKLRKAKKF